MTAPAPVYRDKRLTPTSRQMLEPRDVAAALNANRPVLLELEPGDMTCYTLVISEHFWRGIHSLLVVRLTSGHPKWSAWVTVMPPGQPLIKHEVQQLCPGDEYTVGVLSWYLQLITDQLNRPPF